MNADQFANFMAGYQGTAYDQMLHSPVPAVPIVYGAGLAYHMTGRTKAPGDFWDKTGFPYISQGVAAVPEKPSIANGIYDLSPVY